MDENKLCKDIQGASRYSSGSSICSKSAGFVGRRDIYLSILSSLLNLPTRSRPDRARGLSPPTRRSLQSLFVKGCSMAFQSTVVKSSTVSGLWYVLQVGVPSSVGSTEVMDAEGHLAYAGLLKRRETELTRFQPCGRFLRVIGGKAWGKSSLSLLQPRGKSVCTLRLKLCRNGRWAELANLPNRAVADRDILPCAGLESVVHFEASESVSHLKRGSKTSRTHLDLPPGLPPRYRQARSHVEPHRYSALHRNRRRP